MHVYTRTCFFAYEKGNSLKTIFNFLKISEIAENASKRFLQ
jgi:hypothetical protein